MDFEVDYFEEERDGDHEVSACRQSKKSATCKVTTAAQQVAALHYLPLPSASARQGSVPDDRPATT